MNTMKASYTIRVLSGSKDLDFNKALHIYTESIDMRILTSPREITYWIDNYNNKSKNKFIIFALYLNNELIGYSQVVYFSKCRFIFIDYIAIMKDYRGRAFYEFVHQIRDYFIINDDYEISYFIAEIPIFNDSCYGNSLLRLVKELGFCIVKIPYKQPELGINNRETELDSFLVLCPNNATINSISVESIKCILDTIFFDHYAFWYKDFLKEDQYNEYFQYLCKERNNLSTFLKGKEKIDLDGSSSSFISLGDGVLPALPQKSTIIISFVVYIFSAVSLILMDSNFFGNDHHVGILVIIIMPILLALFTYITIGCLMRDQTIFSTIPALFKEIKHWKIK